MADWNPNNRACTTTWTTLRVLAQTDKPFKKSGTITMDKLTYWNAAATPAMRKLQATTIATQMDNFFREVRGAKYEKGVAQQSAVEDSVETLTDAEKTISDLAGVCDDNYLFWGEDING